LEEFDLFCTVKGWSFCSYALQMWALNTFFYYCSLCLFLFTTYCYIWCWMCSSKTIELNVEPKWVFE